MEPFANLRDGGVQLASELLSAPLLADAYAMTLAPIMPNGVPVTLGMIDGLASRTSLRMRIEPLDVIRSGDGIQIGAVPAIVDDLVVVVDDGVETGTAALASGRALRDVLTPNEKGRRPALLLAVPVCPHQALPDLLGIFDAVIAVHRPLARRSLSWHYVNFDVIDEARARELLGRAP